MRLIQIWVLDVYSPEFAAEALQKSRLVAQSLKKAESQAFINSMFKWHKDALNQSSEERSGPWQVDPAMPSSVVLQ